MWRITLFLLAIGVAHATSINGYEKCTHGGLKDLIANMRGDVENFYLDFEREVEAQADAAIRNLWFNTPHPESMPTYESLPMDSVGCKVDDSKARMADVVFTGWAETDWYNASCPLEMKKQGKRGAAWQNPKAAGCTYPRSASITEFCSVEYPHCKTTELFKNGTELDYLDWHYSGPGGERGWVTSDNNFCPMMCLQPARFNNNINNFMMQLSDGAELRWHELNSYLFDGGVNIVNRSNAGSKFHQGYGWAWFYKSWTGSLFRYIPELETLFGTTWPKIINSCDYVWPFAYEGFPPNNPTKRTHWTQPYKDLAWMKFQVSALAPIYDGPNKELFLGIIGVDVFMDSTETIVNTRKPTPNSQMMMVNQDFKLIFATKTLYSMLLCPGLGTINNHLCGPRVPGKDGDMRGAQPGTTCLIDGAFKGLNTSFDIDLAEANADTIDFRQDAQFITEADAHRLYEAAQSKDAAFVKIAMLRTSRLDPRNHNQCIGSPSCTYVFFFQRFFADNMGWTILNVLPEEDLAKATGVELNASKVNGHIIRVLDEEMSNLVSFDLHNTGLLPIAYSVDIADQTLFAPVTQGTIEGGASFTVHLKVNGAALEPGMQTLTVPVSIHDTLEGSCLSKQLSVQLSVVKSASDQTCPPGQFLEDTTATCLPCRPGTSKSTTGRDCSACPAGTYANTSGRTMCSECIVGHECPSGTTNPVSCNPGFYQEMIGAAACDRCSKGSYQDEPGKASCKACSPTQTTQGPGSVVSGDCGCAPTMYLDQHNVCQQCPDGMSCAGFGGENIVLPGFYSAELPPDPSKGVWICASDGGDAVCVGQTNSSDVVCASNSVGLNCARCADGFTKQGDGTCGDCGNGGTALFPLFLIILVFVCGAFHYAWNHRTLSVELVESVLASITIGVTLAFMQQVGIMQKLNISWPKEFKEILAVVSVLLFDMDFLKFDCVVPESFEGSYIIGITMPLIIGGSFAIWFILSRMIHMLVKSFPAFGASAIFNSVGMVMQALYISFTSSVVGIFQCYESGPGGETVLSAYPWERCYESAWMGMLPFAIIGLIVYVVGFFGLLLWMSYVAPNKWEDESFRIRSRFLVFKYRTDKWWYGIVLLLRSLALAMVPVVSPDDGYVQFFLLLFILVGSIVIHVQLEPYADQYANRLESIELSILVVILSVGSWFIEDRDINGKDEDQAFRLAIVLCCSFIARAIALLGTFIYAVIMMMRPERAMKLQSERISKVRLNYAGHCKTFADLNEECQAKVLSEASYVDLQCMLYTANFTEVLMQGVQPKGMSKQRLSDRGLSRSLSAELAEAPVPAPIESNEEVPEAQPDNGKTYSTL